MTDYSDQNHTSDSSREDRIQSHNPADADQKPGSDTEDSSNDRGQLNTKSTTEIIAEAFRSVSDTLGHLRRRSPTRIKVFRKYFEIYYYHLRSEYDSLPKERKNKDPDKAKRVQDISSQDPVEYYDIFELETIILELQPLETLKSRAWILREKYRQIVPLETYQAYKDSNPPDI